MQNEPEKLSGIEKLKQQLHSRQGIAKDSGRKEFTPFSGDVKKKWKQEERKSYRANYSPLMVALGVSFFFFVVAIAFASFVFLQNSNAVSAENVEIEVIGPIAHPAGEALDLQVVISNKNAAPILLADLIVEYPEGTRSATNVNLELPRIRESIGTIRSGEQITTTISSVLFGEEDTEKPIMLTVEYRLDNSNAIFFKEEVYEVLLNSAPLSVLVETLSEVISGQETEFEVTVSSNSTNAVNDVLLVAEYPFGFDFDRSFPDTSFRSTDTWFLGDLAPGVEKKISIFGTQIGQDEEERVFRFNAGIQSEKSEQEIVAALGQSTVPLTVRKPFVSLDLALNGSTEEVFVVGAGEVIDAEITWRNNLPVAVSDAVITLSFTGERLDSSSVKVGDGFYQSFNDTITWSSDTGADLALVSPNSRGVVEFIFSPTSLSGGITPRDSKIRIDATVLGQRKNERGVPETVESSFTKEILIETDFLLSARTLHASGPFSNSGPVPPVAEQETTYTVTWDITNTANDISNAQLTAKLPSYVRWLNVFTPSNESLSYNAISNTLTWDLGTVPSQTGYSTSPRDVSFQVGVVPSVSQVGQAPTLVNDLRLEGLDRVTDTTIVKEYGSITTRTEDPGRTKFDGHERVIR